MGVLGTRGHWWVWLAAGCGVVTSDEPSAPPEGPLPECGDLDEACEALPQRVDASCGPVGDVWPAHISETGCVVPESPWAWIDGAIPYDVNAPLWTDGAAKDRVLLLSDEGAVSLNSRGGLEFEIGAVLGKRFSLQTDEGSLTVEIRFLRRTIDGWDVVSYAFDGDEPALVGPDPREVVLNWTSPPTVWLYPGEQDCLACHRVDPVLGPTVGQLNKRVDYPSNVGGAAESGWRANQLVAFNAAGLFDPPLTGSVHDLPVVADPEDSSFSIEDRARGVLHGNCGHCHQPGGWSPPDLLLDLRWSTPFSEAHACDTLVMYTTMGTGGEYVFAAGDPENSNALQRMKTRGLGQMPMFGSYQVDQQGVSMVQWWIETLDRCP
jgi:mono/diheme cytochrome c family protein